MALDVQEEEMMLAVSRGIRSRKDLEQFLEMRAEKDQDFKDFLTANIIIDEYE